MGIGGNYPLRNGLTMLNKHFFFQQKVTNKLFVILYI